VLQCVAVCLQRVAVCTTSTSRASNTAATLSLSTGKLPATHCNSLQHTATHCNTLQHTGTHCNSLHHTAAHCNTRQHTAAHCKTLQFTATYCNTLQHTATCCNKLHHTAMTLSHPHRQHTASPTKDTSTHSQIKRHFHKLTDTSLGIVTKTLFLSPTRQCTTLLHHTPNTLSHTHRQHTAPHYITHQKHVHTLTDTMPKKLVKERKRKSRSKHSGNSSATAPSSNSCFGALGSSSCSSVLCVFVQDSFEYV